MRDETVPDYDVRGQLYHACHCMDLRSRPAIAVLKRMYRTAPLLSLRGLLRRSHGARTLASQHGLDLCPFRPDPFASARPAGEILLGDARQSIYPVRPLDQALNIVERLAAGRQEQLARFQRDFLQRFQAIAGETRT